MQHFLLQTGLSLSFSTLVRQRVAKTLLRHTSSPRSLSLGAKKKKVTTPESQDTDRDAVGGDERPRVGSPGRVEVALVNHDRRWPFRFALEGTANSSIEKSGSRSGAFLLVCVCVFFSLSSCACEGVRYATTMRPRWRFVRFCFPERRHRFFFVRDSPLLGVCPSSPRPRPPRPRTYDSRERNENCVTA